MKPEEARSLVDRICQLFKYFPPGTTVSTQIPEAEIEILLRSLEKVPLEVGSAALDRFAEQTSIYDRERFRFWLRDEHARRSPRISPTPEWRKEREAETKTIDQSLKRLPMQKIEYLSDRARNHYPDAFPFLRGNLMDSDFGKALLYDELNAERSTQRRTG
jgi:hypothetical protein